MRAYCELERLARVALWKADRSVADLAKRWAQPPSSFIDIDGMHVHVRDEGPRDDGMPLVLVHGTGNSLHTWDGWVERLKGSHRVVRFDRPGFGLTGPNPSGDYTMKYYAGFVGRLLDVLHIDRCIIVGNSSGGRVAWTFAVDQPARVERLVLIAAAGYPRATPLSTGFRIAMSPLGPFVLHLISRSSVDASVRRTYGDPSKLTQDVLDRSYDMTLRSGVRRALGATLRAAHSIDDSASIAKVDAPTLIMWGSADTVIPATDAARFAADLRGSEVVMFPGVGHLPQEEEPDATVRALRRWIDGADSLQAK
jgi:pimeloyl-ACP methyl ester carboxylesterase